MVIMSMKMDLSFMPLGAYGTRGLGGLRAPQRAAHRPPQGYPRASPKGVAQWPAQGAWTPYGELHQPSWLQPAQPAKGSPTRKGCRQHEKEATSAIT